MALKVTKQLPPNAQNVEWGGFHGYPPGDPDMRTVFFGWGPGKIYLKVRVAVKCKIQIFSCILK